MTTPDTLFNSTVPDLLHRFARTPLNFHFPIGETLVALETNDSRMLAVAASFRSAATLRSATAPEGQTRQFHWKLVRETATSDDAEFSILMTDDLTVLFRGDKSVISVDRNQRELLGFIAADVTEEELRSKLFPLLAKCCEEASPDRQVNL